MPALVYSSKPHETAALPGQRVLPPPTCRLWFITTRRFTNDVTPDILATLTGATIIVCFKDSSGTPVVSSICVTPSAIASFLFAGLDDVVVETSPWARKVGFPACRVLSARRRNPVPVLPRRNAMTGNHGAAIAGCRCCIDARVGSGAVHRCAKLLGRGSAVTRPPRLALEETPSAGDEHRGTGAGDASRAAGRGPGEAGRR